MRKRPVNEGRRTPGPRRLQAASTFTLGRRRSTRTDSARCRHRSTLTPRIDPGPRYALPPSKLAGKTRGATGQDRGSDLASQRRQASVRTLHGRHRLQSSTLSSSAGGAPGEWQRRRPRPVDPARANSSGPCAFFAAGIGESPDSGRARQADSVVEPARKSAMRMARGEGLAWFVHGDEYGRIPETPVRRASRGRPWFRG